MASAVKTQHWSCKRSDVKPTLSSIRIMKKILLLGMILPLTAAQAQAQTGLQRAMAALPPEAAKTLEETVAAARSRGLPTEPLVDKALEGAAKKVQPAMILNAIRQKLELLTRADAALRPYGPPAAADVTATADVLQRGISDDVVKRVRAGFSKEEPIGIALHTLADLIDRGVPVDVALDVLSSWRARGARASELRELPAEVERLVRGGASPSAAGRSVAASMKARGRPSGPPGQNRDRAGPKKKNVPVSPGTQPPGQVKKNN
jgi:hypothetical protein